MTSIGFIRKSSSKGKQVQVPVQDFRHVLITGETGSGKTASVIFPTLKERIKSGNAIVFLEHKGHEHQKIKALAMEENRLSNVIELGKPTGAFFNMMAMFDSNMLRSVIIRLCGREDKDSYWSTSAAQLAVRVIELQRKLHTLGRALNAYLNCDKEIFTLSLTENEPSDYTSLLLDEEASFETLTKIVSTPISIKCFFSNLKSVLKNIDKEIHQHVQESVDISHRLEKIIAEFLMLQNLLNNYENFKIEDSDDAGGNNGVLQILNNAIATLSTLEYINKSEVDIMQLIERNSIIIIDVQSIDSAVYSVFLEAVLKKLSARLKFQIPNPVSFFIDEANRVLSSQMDIQNDVLREAKVELILAIQNEEQMEIKFGATQWQSMVKNMRQHFQVDTNHLVSCNDEGYQEVIPLSFSECQTNSAVYAYNNLEQNRNIIYKRFMIDSDLPKDFKIIFNPDIFLQHSILHICSNEGEMMSILYVGEEVKKKTRIQIERYRIGKLKVKTSKKRNSAYLFDVRYDIPI